MQISDSDNLNLVIHLPQFMHTGRTGNRRQGVIRGGKSLIEIDLIRPFCSETFDKVLLEVVTVFVRSKRD